MTYGKSDIRTSPIYKIKDFEWVPENLGDIIFVPFRTAKPYIARLAAYRIKDISFVQRTNIAEAHFLTECASTTCPFISPLLVDGYVFAAEKA